MKKHLALILALLLAFSLVGCNGAPSAPGGQDQVPPLNQSETIKDNFPVTIIDSYDREVVIEKKPEKLISLSPSNTEILFAIGLEEQLVGVSTFCTYPEAALEKTKVGDFSNPNIELIIELEPEVVFVAAGVQKEMMAQLEKMGIAVVTLDARTIEQVMENINLVGKITGNIKEAQELVAQMKVQVAEVTKKLESVTEKPVVFYEVWHEPLMTAGPGSFIDNLINMAGGKNTAFDAAQEFGQFSVEILIERDPDLYIVSDHGRPTKDVEGTPGYENLKAVKDGKIIVFEDDLITVPGPRLVEGLEKLAKILHPELF